MASPGALRPAVSRVLQRCHTSPAGNGASALTLQSSPTSTRLQAAPWRWSQQQRRELSESAPLEARKTRDRSKLRGVSTIHRSGPRGQLSVSTEELPQPSDEPDAGRMTAAHNDPDHGLWDFFYNKKMVPVPAEVAAHGRSWTAQELRGKSWDDLHALWWICCRERNRLATASHAMDKHKIGFGSRELADRDAVVKKTMKAMKHVLTERYYAWEDAVKVAKDDPEIKLSGDGPVYVPSTYYEEEHTALEEEAAAETTEAESTKLEGDATDSAPEKTSDSAAVDPSTMTSPATKADAEATTRP